jgi:ubiquinone/menaquinone biosynthesis C-methylase UbiE
MIALLKTTERVHNVSYINNYVFQRHVFAYRAALQFQLAGKDVLELGCGEGYGMELIGTHTNSYLAVDKKRPAHLPPGGHVRFQPCRLPHLQGIANNSYDVVICFQVIEHIQNDRQLLAEIKRVLKPGGSLLLTTPNQLTSLTRNPFHIREYRPHQMQQLVSNVFSRFSIQGIYGNNLVMDYYNRNKQAVARITRFDIFNLQYHLPAFLLKGVYSALNNITRFAIARKAPDITAGISHKDFYLDQLTNNCLDYFVIATKAE